MTSENNIEKKRIPDDELDMVAGGEGSEIIDLDRRLPTIPPADPMDLLKRQDIIPPNPHKTIKTGHGPRR
jgi:hypothetical protein